MQVAHVLLVGLAHGGEGCRSVEIDLVQQVHTHLRGEALTRDDLTDLALLRLDVVAAIVVGAHGRPGPLHVGHLLPDGPSDRPWRELPPESVHAPTTDFAELIAGLEQAYGKAHRGTAAASGETRGSYSRMRWRSWATKPSCKGCGRDSGGRPAARRSAA